MWRNLATNYSVKEKNDTAGRKELQEAREMDK
jgi:hypothetical protein